MIKVPGEDPALEGRGAPGHGYQRPCPGNPPVLSPPSLTDIQTAGFDGAESLG